MSIDSSGGLGSAGCRSGHEQGRPDHLVAWRRHRVAVTAGRVASQDNSFVGSGLAGWDECIPTVAACTGADGRAVPDHGSVWARAWTVDGNGYGTVQVDNSGSVDA